MAYEINYAGRFALVLPFGKEKTELLRSDNSSDNDSATEGLALASRKRRKSLPPWPSLILTRSRKGTAIKKRKHISLPEWVRRAREQQHPTGPEAQASICLTPLQDLMREGPIGVILYVRESSCAQRHKQNLDDKFPMTVRVTCGLGL